ncbi:MAG TPA: hypothetical protein PK529_14250, partial [Verrucomicrobiales bacterium]|nr:hypothetical protein [Verrucomicrobiales bacterium]
MEKTPAEENPGAPEATPGAGTPEVPETVNQTAGAGVAQANKGDLAVSKSSTPPVAPGTAAGTAAGVTKLKAAALAITAAALGAAGAVYGPPLFKQSSSNPGSSVSNGGNVAVVKDSGPKVGFTFGKLPATEPVEKIVVTLTAGAEGKAINERVDLHLGMGFPLRLFPLGNESREPAFAALPQKSSLPRGVTSIKPGESATFEFFVKGEDGQDVLNTTPQLLKDLKVGDIKGVGFSSIGENGWILGGYRVEVNGKLFAANDSVNVRSDMVLAQIRRDLALGKPESEVLLKEIANLKKTTATGLSNPADKAKLAEKEAALAEIAEPLNRLAGQGAGYYPWYVERNEQFLSALAVASPVGEVGVKLTAGGGGDPGTRNPVYLKAGSKKFLLTSETDPLAARTGPQEFTISMADLEQNPMTLADLDKPGLGIIGNEERYGQVPDRAKIQRIQVTVDGKPIYDSESKAEDRRALEAYWLVPPVHYDYTGQLVRNEEKPTEKHLWASGMVAPRDLPVTKKPLAPEMPPRLGSPGIGGPGIGGPGIGGPGIGGPG